MPGARWLLLPLVLAASSWSFEASAAGDDPATRAAGRKLAQDGVGLFQQGQHQAASDKLEKAYELVRVPSIALWSGRALAARGLLVEAAERYVEASRLSGFKGDQQVQLDAQREAQKELEALMPRIPTLVIAVVPSAGARPEVTLDGKEVPTALWGEEQPINPGKHVLRLVAAGKELVREVTLAEAEKKRETLAPEQAATGASTGTTPDAEAAASPSGGLQRTLAFVALAAGGAGLVVGGVTGGMALSKHGSLEDSGRCAGNVCLPSAQDDVDSLDTLRTISTVGFIAGGVLAATGVVLLLTDKPAGTDRVGLALRIAPSALTLTGGF